jgi:REP element-mobilizing transposase RayT
MPQSLARIYAHLIFSTKNRSPLLVDDLRPRVHAYLATITRDLGSPYITVGGVADHVHLLFQMNKTNAPSDYPRILKSESTKFIKSLDPAYGHFGWQRGYGMFSVSPTQLEAAEQYVRNQEDHHRNLSFEDEFRAFLNRYNMAYDEKYVWD